MDKQKAASEILDALLPLVPFDGWNQRTLAQAAFEAGYKKTDAIRVFPGGALEAIDAFLARSDREMEEALAGYFLDNMKIRERITLAMRTKITGLAPHREALRRALALHAMPFNCHHALRAVYRTVDTAWYAIGDASTDFNFYTKRLTLAGVYSSTLLYWLDDRSPGFENSWAFLDRRIADVMTIEKGKYQLRQWYHRTFA